MSQPVDSLSTLQQEHQCDIPSPLTSLIGREQEVTHLSMLLRNPEVRLLVLLGPGGVGKTRLSIEVASRVQEDFADGVYFVSLAAVNDSTQMLFAIAQCLYIRGIETRPLMDLVVAGLHTKQLLLLLDNLEQVQDAALTLAELLGACHTLKIMVTSRAALRIPGEREFMIRPLALPPLDSLPDPEALQQYAAVTLFLQRVQSLVPAFQLLETNARVIAEICVRLDGLPLALELAAARIKLLPPQALLARLSRRLQILTAGARTLPVRQQTLYNTLKWSYDLLQPQEQKLFQRLSVFVNGCTLQTIEWLYTFLNANNSAEPVLNIVAALVDYCLLQGEDWDDPDRRLFMLETIREYGQDCLAASGEIEIVRAAHATYYVTLAEEIEPELDGVRQAMQMDRLERERGNLRAAFLWLVTQEEENQEENRDLALRMGGSLRLFWLARGCQSDELRGLERALMTSKPISPGTRAKALLTLGTLLSLQGEHSRAEELCTESLMLFHQLPEPRRVAAALYQLGRIAWIRGDLTRARTLAEEALLSARASGHQGSIVWSLFRLARLAIDQGEYSKGQVLLEENWAMHKQAGNKRGIASSLYHLAWIYLVKHNDLDTAHGLIADAQELFRECGDKEGIAYCLYLTGWLALRRQEIAKAQLLLEEGLALFNKLSHQEGIAQTLLLMARVRIAQNSYPEAHTIYKEGIEIAERLDHKSLLAAYLENLASLIAIWVQPQEQREQGATFAQEESSPNLWWAARLWGKAEALRRISGIPMLPIDRMAYEQAIGAAARQLGEEAFACVWAEGREMPITQILLNQARGSISQLPRIEQEASSRAVPSLGLTTREVEVLILVAQGLTSVLIAERLTISLLTVNSHVRSIYNKLGVNSRSAATRYAIEHKLV